MNPDAPCDWTKRNYRTSYILNDEGTAVEASVTDVNFDELEYDFTHETVTYTYAEYEKLLADGYVLDDAFYGGSNPDWTKRIYCIHIINDEGKEEKICVKSEWYIEDDEELTLDEIIDKPDKTDKDVIAGLFDVVDGVLNGEITDEEALQLANKILKGDATGDGEVDIIDVISVNKAILGQTVLSISAQQASDIDGDGIVSPSDSLAIMQYIVGLSEEL